MRNQKICALVPAAGLSSRMGDFKPLLPFRGKTVIESSVESALLGGADSVTVVTGYRSEEIERTLAEAFGDRVRFVRNENYAETDMMHSIRLGVGALQECDAFFLLPGDMPAVSEKTFVRLLSERERSGCMVIIPTLNGAQTHPPLIDSGMIPRILEFSGNGGLRELWKQFGDDIKTVPVDDRGTSMDIDTPGDYQEMRKLYEKETDMSEVKNKISKSVVKKDHAVKMSGRAVYVADYPSEGVLCGRILHSKLAHAEILKVNLPDLPEGYFYVDAKDVPGHNNVIIEQDETPVFTRGTVEYIGEAIGMLVGPDERTVRQFLSQCEVEYRELEPVTDIRKATEVFAEFETGHGDVEGAFAQADKVYEEEFRTGYQEQLYLETQGIMAEPEEDGRLFVHGSIQDVFYVHDALKRVLGCDDSKIHVTQDTIGGAFGGKEDYPSILAAEVAVAALKCGKPVRCVLDRREDMECSPKRHPSLSRYRAAVKDGMVTALDIDTTIDAGGYLTLSGLVLERMVFECMSVYNIPNIHVHGRAVKTNTVPGGAFRGFGGPQIIFAAEMMMSHIARDLGTEPLAFKQKHLAKKDDYTVTLGKYHFNVPLPAMVEELDKACDYRRKREEYSKPQTGRYRRGIGLSFGMHGAGLGGIGEKDFAKATVRLHKYEDGRVEILAASNEIGQGVFTTFSKIVAQELEIPLDQVFHEMPDTGRVPDSGPTAASRSILVVGKLLQRAAAKLKEQWQDGKEQEVEEHYKYPDYLIPYDPEKMYGDAYQTYIWSVSSVEIEIDTYTCETKILDACAVFDVGVPIDYNVVIGQLEGGFMQSIGFAYMENMKYDGRGYIRNNNLGDYLIPTTVDVPNLRVLLHVEEQPDGPFGASGLGELPLVGGLGAYVEAAEQALGGASFHHVPFIGEDVAAALEKEGN